MSLMDCAGGMDFTSEVQDALIAQIGRDLFRLWFGQVTKCVRRSNSVDVVIAAQFALDRIGSRYMKELREAVASVCGTEVVVQLTLETPTQKAKPTNEKNAPAVERVRKGKQRRQSSAEMVPADDTLRRVVGSVNPKPAPPSGPSWESMVPGKSNKLALTAARMVCDAPGSASPLFVWGNHGTGKSLLLNILARDLRQRHRFRRVISMTAEEFTNDFLGSLSGSGLPGFRRRYRDVDALILDEVQFLPGKRATSREMLYTIDAIMRAGKQLVFAADRPPMEIDGLGAELGGRMASGMVCSISPLDSETRAEVLIRMCLQHQIEIDPGLLKEIAENVVGDGRILSGIACRLKAVVQMHQGDVGREEIYGALSDLLVVGKSVCGFSDIQSAICNVMGLPKDALQSPGQTRNISQARMLAMYLAREHTSATYGEIGEYFGHRSHSAVIAATRRVVHNMESGKTFAVGRRKVPIKQMLETVETMLQSG